MTVTGLDWLIIVFALLMGGLGLPAGADRRACSASAASRSAPSSAAGWGPALLPDGSHSPYAPATALAGALLIGGIARRLAGGGRARDPQAAARAGRAQARGRDRRVRRGGACCSPRWRLGARLAVRRGGPATHRAPRTCGRPSSARPSSRALNDAFPPSGSLINALNRIDPRVAVQGPSPDVAAPDSKIAQRPRRAGRGRQRRAGARDRLRARRRGLRLDRGARSRRHQRPRGRGRGRHHGHARRRRALHWTRPRSTTTPRTISPCCA